MKLIENFLFIGGLIIIALIGYYFINQRIQASQQATTATTENNLYAQSVEQEDEAAFVDQLFGSNAGTGVTAEPGLTGTNATSSTAPSTATITNSN